MFTPHKVREGTASCPYARVQSVVKNGVHEHLAYLQAEILLFSSLFGVKVIF